METFNLITVCRHVFFLHPVIDTQLANPAPAYEQDGDHPSEERERRDREQRERQQRERQQREREEQASLLLAYELAREEQREREQREQRDLADLIHTLSLEDGSSGTSFEQYLDTISDRQYAFEVNRG